MANTGGWVDNDDTAMVRGNRMKGSIMGDTTKTIPNTQALCRRVAKLPEPLRDKLAVLGLQRVYELSIVAGYKDVPAAVRRRLKRLGAD